MIKVGKVEYINETCKMVTKGIKGKRETGRRQDVGIKRNEGGEKKGLRLPCQCPFYANKIGESREGMRTKRIQNKRRKKDEWKVRKLRKE